MIWPDQGLRFDNEINSGQKHTRPSRGGSACSSPPPTPVVNPSSPDSQLRPWARRKATSAACAMLSCYCVNFVTHGALVSGQHPQIPA